MRQQFTMTIPMALTISNNRASERWKRKKVKDGISELTRVAAADRYPVGKANIFIGVHKRTNGLYDPTNLADTFKPCVDMLVKMGILDEDDYRHVNGPFCYHAGVDKRIPEKHMRATVYLTDYAPIPFGDW